MKRSLFCVFIIAVSALFLPFNVAFAEEQTPQQQLEQQTDTQLQQIEWDQLEQFLAEYSSGNTFARGGFLNTVKSILDGSKVIDEQTYIEFLLGLFTDGIKQLLPSIATVIVVALLMSIVTRSRTSGGSIGEIVYFVCYAVIIASILMPIWTLVEEARDTLHRVRELSTLVMPVLLTLMTAIGAQSGVAALQPSTALLSGGIIGFVTSVILPLAILAIVFCVVSNMSQSVRLNKFSSFFRSTSSVLLGLVFTVFTAFLTVNGISSGIADGVSLRAVKFATRNYLPILGGYLAEGLDLVLASGILIKNAVGVCALLLLVGIISAPVLKIMLFSLALQFAAAVIEPISDTRIVSFLTECAKGLTLLYVCVIAVAFMFFLLCMLAVCTANVL